MSECPYVDHSFIPNPTFNRVVNYTDSDKSEYVYYEHNDGFGHLSDVQFCKLIGRKRDVFECLNESEWGRCSYYRMVAARSGGKKAV